MFAHLVIRQDDSAQPPHTHKHEHTYISLQSHEDVWVEYGKLIEPSY